MKNGQTVASLLVGLFFLGLVFAPVVIGFFWVTPQMADIFGGIPNLAPNFNHPLGTQSEGRDMLSIMMQATPSTLAIGLIGGGLAMLIGSMVGLIAGYFGGVVDNIARTVVDVVLTIPPLAILILIAASFPVVSIWAMGVVIALTGWMGPSRVVRAQMLTLREREFVRVAKLSNVGDMRIILFELMPNLLPLLLALFVNTVMTAIAASIGLEVLGLGPRQTLTLGNTIYEALYYTAMWRGMWWWWGPPVLSLVCLFLSLFFLSMAFDHFANPKLRWTNS